MVAYYIVFHSKTSESKSSNIPSSLVFNPVENIKTEIISRAVNPKCIHKPSQNLFVCFLDKVPEANTYLEQAVIVSSATD